MSEKELLPQQIREITQGILARQDTNEIADFVAFRLMALYGCEIDPFAVNIGNLLADIRQKASFEESIPLIIQKACEVAGAVHGSFVEVDHEAGVLRILSSYGPDWTEEKMNCLLKIGEGLTGIVAASGQPRLCNDASNDPNYFPLFDYVKSELVVPVIIDGKVWGLINIDGLEENAFDEKTLHLLTVFAEMVALSATIQLHMRNQSKLQEQIIQSEKMASLGRAIAGIAHEINNPLTAILGHASLLKLRNQQSDPATLQSIEAIYRETIRTADLVKGLLAFARKESPKRQVTGVNELVHAVAGLKKYQLQVQNTELQLDLENISYPVEICPQQIQQVLINLITNAEQAIPKTHRRGRVVVSVRRSGHKVLIRVSDNGSGIPEGSRKYIFDPFYTTKDPGQGTGLGLSLATTLMENNGGNLLLEKTSSEGTTFLIELPLCAANGALEMALEKATPDIIPEQESARISVLIVDDEPQVIQTLGDYMDMEGYTVSMVKSAYAALDIMQTVTFDVVISDVRMPGMDGMEFYQKTIELFPSYRGRFIFMSGDLMRENVMTRIREFECPCIEKPFLLQDMVKLISSVINPRAVAATDH
ncbi:ATP-binding protein [Oscillatoria amoena NRMC-F 0135]|nr:ATP-binding protein [Oscillatoria laete-virens]MDL5050296.1 ATP-binding protein [Oscillatoria amoena NRMC-F 0135]MDL5055129.1 ATP-binding protein [Oscillatoria laete-virens NRMC-F 0139]